MPYFNFIFGYPSLATYLYDYIWRCGWSATDADTFDESCEPVCNETKRLHSINSINNDDAMMNDVICPCCFSTASLRHMECLCFITGFWLTNVFSLSLTTLYHTCVNVPYDFAAYCQFCHTSIIALSKYSYIHNFSDKPLAPRISENIHKVRWEKSRYANFPSITPPQVLCIPRGGGWDLHSSYIPYRICIVLYFHTSLQVLCRLVGVGGHLCGKHSSYF